MKKALMILLLFVKFFSPQIWGNRVCPQEDIRNVGILCYKKTNNEIKYYHYSTKKLSKDCIN